MCIRDRILGDGEFWLRPPYGLFDSSVRKWADCPICLLYTSRCV